MHDVIAPSVAGSAISAWRHTKLGKLVVLRVFVTGLLFAYFATEDVQHLLEWAGLEVSDRGTHFFVALTGAAIVEKLISVIDAAKISTGWFKT